MRIEHSARSSQFLAQCVGAAAHCRQSFDLAGIERRAKFFALLSQGSKPLLANLPQLLRLPGKFCNRSVDLTAQTADLTLAGLTKFIEFVEAGDQVLNLRVRRAARSGDIVGYILAELAITGS